MARACRLLWGVELSDSCVSRLTLLSLLASRRSLTTLSSPLLPSEPGRAPATPSSARLLLLTLGEGPVEYPESW